MRDLADGTIFPTSAWRQPIHPSVARTILDRLGDSCSSSLDPAAHDAWLTAITDAAKDFANKQSGGAHVIAAITDAVALRTGGECASTLAPSTKVGATGFIRGLQLLSGAAQTVQWWRPHPAYVGPDVSTKVQPGDLWLHHASMPFSSHPRQRAEERRRDAGAVWLLFHVWFTSPTPTHSQRTGTPGELHTFWNVGIRQHTNNDLERAASRLLRAATRGELPEGMSSRNAGSIGRRRRDDTEADSTHSCVQEAVARSLHLESDDNTTCCGDNTDGHSSATGVCAAWGGRDGRYCEHGTSTLKSGKSEGGSGEGEEPLSVHEALRLVQDAALDEAASLNPTSPPLTVLRASHWRLPPRSLLPPQPAAVGVTRALFVLSPAGSSGGGRLRLRLLDPRPPGVRLSALGSAAWPFGTTNAFVAPLTPSGTLLVMPSTLGLSSAHLRATRHAAHWLELTLGPRQKQQQGEQREESCTWSPAALMPPLTSPPPQPPLPLPPSPPSPHLDAEPVTRRLHATAVSVRRPTDPAVLQAVADAAELVRFHAGSTPSANVSNVGGWQSRADYLMDEPTLLKLLYPLVHAAITSHLRSALPRRALHRLGQLDVRLSGWANANRRGDSNALHEHVDQDWALSGVLYLDDGGDAKCSLRFHSPLPPAPYTDAGRVATPAKGAGEDGNRDGSGDGVGLNAEGDGEADECIDDDAALGDALSWPAAAPAAGVSVVFPSWLSHSVPPHCGPHTRLSVAFNAAALLPSRMWPDNTPSQPTPGLAKSLKTASRSQVLQLWPLRLTMASAAASPALDGVVRALLPEHRPTGSASRKVLDGDGSSDGCLPDARLVRCCLGLRDGTAAHSVYPSGCAPCEQASGAGIAGGGEAAAYKADGTVGPLWGPIAATLRHALAYNRSEPTPPPTARLVEVHACVLATTTWPLDSAVAARSLAARAPFRSRALLGAGMLFLPPLPTVDTANPRAEESLAVDKCIYSRRLALPDLRNAAGDLASNVAWRDTVERGGVHNDGIAVPQGAVVVFPPWARALAYHTTPQCEAKERAGGVIFFRAVALRATASL